VTLAKSAQTVPNQYVSGIGESSTGMASSQLMISPWAVAAFDRNGLLQGSEGSASISGRIGLQYREESGHGPESAWVFENILL
jgi:hypothetical protein